MFPLSAACCRGRLASFFWRAEYLRRGGTAGVRYSLKPVQEETQVPRCRASGFDPRAPLLYRGDVDAAHLIPRSVLTPAQAGITWGVPVARAVRVADSGGRGSRSLGWRRRRSPRETPKEEVQGRWWKPATRAGSSK